MAAITSAAVIARGERGESCVAGKLCRKEGRVLTCDAVAVVHDESGGDDDEYVRLGVPGGGGEFGHGPLELGHGARARGSDQTHGCRRVE